LDINGLGAAPVYRGGTTKVTTHYGVGSVVLMTYTTIDSSGCWQTADYSASYSPESLGFGYATCSTEASTKAKTASLTSYSLKKNGIVAVKFSKAVSVASATLNINSKGAKSIYYRGAALAANVIAAGDICLFIYDGSYYHLLAKDQHSHSVSLTAASNGASTSTNTGSSTGSSANQSTGSTTPTFSGTAVTSGANSGDGVAVATAVAANGTATALTGVKASSTATVVTGVSGGSGTLTAYDAATDGTEQVANGTRIPFVTSISSTGASANGTATVLKGVKVSSTGSAAPSGHTHSVTVSGTTGGNSGTNVSAVTGYGSFSGGSGSLEAYDAATNGTKKVPNGTRIPVITSLSKSGYTPAGTVSLTNGTAPSMNWNTGTNTDTPYISAISGGSAVSKTTK
jgi:hypothetical protein